MTVKDFLTRLEQASNLYAPNPEKGTLFNAMQDNTEIWSNGACTGYAISAAIAAGLDEHQTAKLVDALHAAFSEMSVDEAERFYQSGEF
jgi:hypothetical protein